MCSGGKLKADTCSDADDELPESKGMRQKD